MARSMDERQYINGLIDGALLRFCYTTPPQKKNGYARESRDAKLRVLEGINRW